MKLKEWELTSVKLNKSLYKLFKIKCIEDDMTLQEIVNKSIFLYTSDLKYHTLIHQTVITGSII